MRGFSAPDLIIEDEAAFVQDSFYWAVRPMLAVSGGRLILMGTPFGRRGHFYSAWREGGDWNRVEVGQRLNFAIAGGRLEQRGYVIADRALDV